MPVARVVRRGGRRGMRRKSPAVCAGHLFSAAAASARCGPRRRRARARHDRRVLPRVETAAESLARAPDDQRRTHIRPRKFMRQQPAVLLEAREVLARDAPPAPCWWSARCRRPSGRRRRRRRALSLATASTSAQISARSCCSGRGRRMPHLLLQKHVAGHRQTDQRLALRVRRSPSAARPSRSRRRTQPATPMRSSTSATRAARYPPSEKPSSR